MRGEGKAKMAREVRERVKVEGGKGERSVPGMMVVSTWMEGLGLAGLVGLWLFQWVLASMTAWFAEMKSALMSTAEMWMLGWDRMAGWRRSWVVRTRGPQALSRIRRGCVEGGREGVMRVMSWLAMSMLQPPVRWL